jgi:ubiquinol-cytochrome c reductase cytochrome c subunit
MTRLRDGPRQLAIPAVLTIAITAVVLFLGRSTGRAQGPSPTPTTSSGPGRGLYQQDCAWCHGADGEGTPYGPSLIGVGAASADFMLTTGRMPIPNVETQPQRRDPAYTPEEIDALVQFVASLGPGPPIPAVDPTLGVLGQGQQLYELHCAACHSSTGFGGALTNGLQAPGLERSSAIQIAEAVRIGGAGYRTGHMPRFGSEVLDDRQLDSVIRYVLYLQHPEDRGGQDLGHVGPIAEGFVAWFGALVILVVFVRWIGTRS